MCHICGEDVICCDLCAHRCKIHDGKTGICGVRKNIAGTLTPLTYGKVSAEAIDPIEKKPLNHFLPGTYTYSLGGIGCNFRCKHCQNWEISQISEYRGYLRDISPEEGVRRAVENECKSIAWTYNEPTIWHEYTKDMGTLTKKQNLKTIYVTNGYITEEALKDISSMLDAFRVDIKSFSDSFYRSVCSARLEPVLNSTIVAKECGMHIETVTLIIPGMNDSPDEIRALIHWVVENIGPDTPMHFTGFYPQYHMTDKMPTTVAVLERACEIAKEEGILYPYTGNVGNTDYQNTYCHSCGAQLIERNGYRTKIVGLDGTTCSACGENIPIVI
ncbi:AmmeMemoRadiSam system radical SAM enzyme [Methanogenium organophilum]|uniref:AmmeMemoRadiSam system radical SAM enzyme n=1 Tax=Methanogenium organophilum TaxID=2199 RepID=A0A9X9T8X3_METOG|nr:AmmeMemoRadiSam system radical SAM enzyme [Methanogenium organophilum]